MAENRLPGCGIRYPEIDVSSLSLGGREIVEEVESRTMRAGMFVALGKDAKESESVLMWALHNSRGMKIYVLHIYQPLRTIPMLGPTKIKPDLINTQMIEVHQQIKREDMHKTLDKYIEICNQAGVRAIKVFEEMDSIEEGIVQLISKHGIKFLVMGAAVDKCYSRRMTELKSKKAIHVHREAPSFCHIWFTCKGNLIHTRRRKLGDISMEMGSPQFQASPSAEAAQYPRSQSVAEERRNQTNVQNLVRDYRRVVSEKHGMQFLVRSNVSGESSPQGFLNPEGNSDRGSSVSWRSPSESPHLSIGSMESIVFQAPRAESNESEGGVLPMFQMNHEDHCHSSAAASAVEGNMNDELLEKYVAQILAKAEQCKKEAHEESVKRMKAEKDVFDLIRRAKAYETVCAEEVRCRKEIKEALQREKEEAAKTKWKLDEVLEDLRVAQDQKFALECQIQGSNKKVDELEQKLFSAVELLQRYKTERDEFEFECDNAVKVTEELRNKLAEVSSSSSTFFSQFSYSDIEEATGNFCQSLKIGEGGYGIIYRGELRHTQVAIKIRHPNSLQGPPEFQCEVNILSKLRHPYVVNLIGACPEAWALIYEYLPNGSLEDRLNCKNNTKPLPWKTRIRIATELCSALIFLHSSQPQGFVHGDVKPSNVLLDDNFVCKLSDFGICRQLPRDEFPENNGTVCCKTDHPRGTLVYIDPEFLATGELTSKSDVYSFGIVLLRLLTGRPAVGIVKEVQCALDKGKLQDLLDPTAGDWPFVQANQLAKLAVRCSDGNRRNRPDLASEVWRVMKRMKVSCGGILSHWHGSEDFLEIPSYFACPIFQEIMQDPVIAADGFTYESEAIKGWLENGHDNSPMTNLNLPHCNLLPNHALRAAIQEWLQNPRG